jgi:mannosyl-oligosaccharide alpha-1,2-mannosidase
VESLFILWRITGDVKYREWGWTIFQAFEKWGKVGNGGGYTSLDDVTQIPPPKRDSMESFWLVTPKQNRLCVCVDFQAETLKYLYLLFGPDDILPLNTVVFNTEAHPFPVFPMDTHFKTGWTIKDSQQ